jgi:DNA-binding MltR family transcriptional regulator
MRKPIKLQKPLPQSFEEKLTPEETAAFFEQSSDRAMAVIWGAIVENHLTGVLRLLMRRDNEAVANELFKPTGPLGAFGTKIRVAYMLRIIEPASYNDYLIVSKIRNAFAHDLSKTSFEDQQISAWIKNMNIYAIVIKMGKDAAERIEKGQSKGTVDFVASGFNNTIRDSYRNSLRFLIHGLSDYERAIKFTENLINQPQPPPPPEID